MSLGTFPTKADANEKTTGYYAIGSGAGFAQMSMALMAHFDITHRGLDAAKLVAYRALDAVINSRTRGWDTPSSSGP